MKIETSLFGITKEGQEVKKYTLMNSLGYSVSILNYGGIICGLNVPDKNGKVENIVLGYNDISRYEENAPNAQYFGCFVGRTAGRISNAEFTINQTAYKLAKNNGNNTLHGGIKGFNSVIWSVKKIIENNCIGLSLTYLSKHLEEGYPGNLDTEIIYRWNDENQLTIQYLAETDEETLITLTNHSYFNLSGDLSSTILDHYLKINADQFVIIREDAVPYDIGNVEGTAFDFRIGKEIGKDINKDEEQIINGNGFDHPFILNEIKEAQITLIHKDSGRKLSVTTDEKCVVCYTGNFLSSEIKVYDNVSIQHRGGVCLETQYYPDSLNFDLVPSKTIKPNEVYKQTTVYEFSVLNDML